MAEVPGCIHPEGQEDVTIFEKLILAFDKAQGNNITI